MERGCVFVVRLAFTIKLAMLLLQVVCNVMVPDHQGSMDDVEMKAHRHPQHDPVTETVLGGFDNWDSEYYIHIAQHGHTFLQSMAFFPLYPALMRLLGHTVLSPLGLLLTDRSLCLLAGTLVNLCIFPLAALSLYLLTLSVSRRQPFSLVTVLLFCLNPASVFMSAVYTETLFSFLTFAGLYLLTQHCSWTASVLFSLASATRANGVVLTGFIAYYHLNNMFHKTTSKAVSRSIVKYNVGVVIVCTLQCLVVVLPFFLFQLYSYWKFCLLPASGGEEVYEWCQWSLPLSYSFIQQHYWKVGFLRYYQWKQVPNFLLASPVVVLSLSALYSYFCSTAGILRWTRQSGVGMLAYALHLLFLTGFGVFNMHIQVLTRFLFSSTPLLYWFAAGVLSAYPSSSPPTPLSIRHLVTPLLNHLLPLSRAKSPSLGARLIVLYFISYVVVGFILHCNFYPWT